MQKLIKAFIFLFLLMPSAHATVYYVRTDGGTGAQCNGLVNVALAGASGSNCAWNHPFWATKWFGDAGNGAGDPRGTTPVVGGDTVIVAPGQYAIGYNAQFAGCSNGYTYGCAPQPLPSGTSFATRTRMIGCSVSGCSNRSQYPEFYGVGRVAWVVSIDGRNWLEISDINITDHATCGVGHSTLDAGAVCGAAAGGTSALTANIGVYGLNWTNIYLTNLWIHGVRDKAMYVGRGQNITLTNVIMDKNAFTAWDGDVCAKIVSGGECKTGNACLSSNPGMTGSIILNNVQVTYNGCVEAYPVVGQPGEPSGIASQGCYSQSQSGYGDGIGTCDTGGNWVLSGCDISHNGSDGLDLLYHSRGVYNTGTNTIIIKRSKFEGNAGNNVKGTNNMYVEDVINIGNCRYFRGQAFTLTAGSASSGQPFDDCRAAGSNYAIEFKSGDSAIPVLTNTTNLTNADTVIVTSGVCATGSQVHAYNSIFLGGSDATDTSGGDRPGIYYNSAADFVPPTVCTPTFVERNNVCLDFKEGSAACPHPSSRMANPLLLGTIQQGPLGIGGVYYTSTNYAGQVGLQSTSPARDLADESLTSSDDALDVNGFDRGAAWDSGALEFGSIPTGSSCGNGTIETGEDCEGSDLNGESCTTIGGGYIGGTLSCTPSCFFDTTSCASPGVPICGDGTIDAGEECDDGNTTNNDCCSSTCQDEESGIENFTDTARWTEVDPSSHMSLFSDKVVVTNLDRNSSTTVRHDGGAGHFTDFTQTFKVELTSCDAPDGTCFAILWNMTENPYSNHVAVDAANDGLYIAIYQEEAASGGSFLWFFGDSLTNTEVEYADSALPLTRYVKIIRTGTAMSVGLYSDSNFSSLIFNANVTPAASTAYRYLHTPISWNDGFTDASFNFNIVDLNIGESIRDCGGGVPTPSGDSGQNVVMTPGCSAVGRFEIP